MNEEKRTELEARFKEALKEHQHEGLHMVGGAEQLVARLVRTVEEWTEGRPEERRKAA
jgi:hypothetical protein